MSSCEKWHVLLRCDGFRDVACAACILCVSFYCISFYFMHRLWLCLVSSLLVYACYAYTRAASATSCKEAEYLSCPALCSCHLMRVPSGWKLFACYLDIPPIPHTACTETRDYLTRLLLAPVCQVTHAARGLLSLTWVAMTYVKECADSGPLLMRIAAQTVTLKQTPESGAWFLAWRTNQTAG